MSELAQALIDAGVAKPVGSTEPTKLEQALEKTNTKHKRKPKNNRRRWNSAKAEQQTTITWQHEIGTVTFTIEQFRLGHAYTQNGVYWAMIDKREHEPKEVVVNVATNLAEGVIPLWTKGGDVIDCGDAPIPDLRVPVKWRREKGVSIPHTRVKDMDNAGLILRLPSGEFIDLQVAVLTRGGTFYLSLQEVSSGQIIKLPDDIDSEDVGFEKVAIADQGSFIIVPLYSAHAYPGASYLKHVMPRSGPKFVEMSVSDGAYTEVNKGDTFEVPDWDAPGFPAKPGWQMGGIVLWFNPIVGGKVLCADGVECFVPVGSIQNERHKSAMREGDFPIMVPRQQVLLRYKDAEKGRLAIEVEPIPVEEE